MIIADIVVVGEIVTAFSIGQCLGPSVSGQKIHPARDSLLNFQLQALIRRVVAVTHIIDGLTEAELMERTTKIKVRPGSGHGLIFIAVQIQMSAHIADIGGFHRERRLDLLLYGEVPRVAQWYAIRTRRVEIEEHADAVRQRVTSGRPDGRVRGWRRTAA